MKRTKEIVEFAKAVGDFMRYWGFRRIHGQAWTIIFLSEAPVSGTEVSQILKVSKALISPAIHELEKYGLIEQITTHDQKTKHYKAKSDFFAVIQDILKKREKPMLEKARTAFDALQLISFKNKESGIDQKNIDVLESLIDHAQLGLDFVLCSSDLNSLGLSSNLLNQTNQPSESQR